MSHSRQQDFERTLLQSGAREAPSGSRRSAARAAVLRAAGIGAAVASATLATSTVAPSVAPAAAAPVASAVKLTLMTKIVLLSAMAVGLVSGAVVVSTRKGPTMAATNLAPPAAVAPVEVSSAAIDVAQLPAAPANAPVQAPAPAAVPRPQPTSHAHAEAVDPVAAEARVLDAARRRLAAGDRACARARLAEHDAKFRGGVLQEEARVLEERIERSGVAR